LNPSFPFAPTDINAGGFKISFIFTASTGFGDSCTIKSSDSSVYSSQFMPTLLSTLLISPVLDATLQCV
jgi:hypothetical protein